MNLRNISKTLVYISVTWFLYVAANFLLKFRSFQALEMDINLIELAVGFAAAILLFAHYYKTKQFLPMGIGLAVLSWTLGQLFWFSYEMIKANALPYPSVGDFGFLGSYFFIAGSIGNIKSDNRHLLIILTSVLLIMLIPVFFLFESRSTYGVLVYNFIYTSSIVYVLYKTLIKFLNDYKYLFIGILVFCLADIIFIIEANINDYTIYSDMFYPLSLSLLAYGAMKAGAKNG